MSEKEANTVLALIEHCAALLEDSGVFFGHGTDNSWDEAVQLVLYACDLPLDADDSAAARTVTAAQRQRAQELLQQRIVQGVPLPYLTGSSVFAGLTFKVDRRAIIPRSPIAELIEQAYAPWWLAPKEGARILDLCCGGGAIGIASAIHIPDATVDIADIDPDALALAGENIALHGVEARVYAMRSDVFDGLGGRRYDLIVSNPPYVDARDLAQMPREYHHEPALALGSGADGLDLSRRILAQASHYLTLDGTLVLEVGNSWPALEAAFPTLPFTWIELERGGHGVCVLQADQLP